MSKTYTSPNLKIIDLAIQDVVTASNNTWSDNASKDFGSDWIWGGAEE